MVLYEYIFVQKKANVLCFSKFLLSLTTNIHITFVNMIR